MADFRLAATEIVAILESCRENGVQELSYGPLSVSFGLPTNRVPFLGASPWLPPGNASPPQAASTLAEPDHDAINRNTLETEEVRTREDQLAELLLTDPVAAEEMMVAGELTPDDGRSEQAV